MNTNHQTSHSRRMKCSTKRMEKILMVGYIVLPFLFFIVTASFVSADTINKDGVSSSKKTNSLQWPICQGYTTYDEAIAPASPITNCTSIKQDASGSSSFSLISSLKNFDSQVGVSGQVNIPVKFAELDSISSFKNSYVNDNLDLSLIYSVSWGNKYIAKPASGTVLTVSDKAKALYEKSSSAFVNRYGNEYISQVEAGVKLFVMLNIHFSSQNEKADFENSINLHTNGTGSKSSDIQKVTLALKAMFNKQHMSGSISIKTLQLGGDPSQLATIFNDKTKMANYDFASLKDADDDINKLVGYIASLNTQLINNQSSVYVFHIDKAFSYKTILPEYNLPVTGNLTAPTLRAREIIRDIHDIYQLLDKNIAFKIYNTFPDIIPSALANEIKVAEKTRNALHDFFYTKDSNAVQAQCYKPGSENSTCKVAAMNMYELLYDSRDKVSKFLKDTQQLNYTVNIGDRYAAYPVSLIQDDGANLKQHFIFFTLNNKHFESDIIVSKKGKNNKDALARGLFSYIEQPGIELSFKSVGFDNNGNRTTPEVTAKKVGTHTFLDNNNEEITFLNSIYKPYPAGKICLHSDAWVNIELSNVETHKQASDVSLFRSGEINAAVGDVIKIKPRFLNNCTREFIVTRPGNIAELKGKVHGLNTVPLYGTLKTAGTALKCKYFSVTATSDGSVKCPVE